MPPEIMDQNGSSSLSFFSQQFCLPSQRQVGFSMPDHHGTNAISQTFGSMSVVSSPLEKILPAVQSMGSLELPQPPTIKNQNTNLFVQPGPYIVGGDKDGENGAQHQRSPFSSSLSEIFKKNVRLSSNDFLFRQTINAVASHDVEEEPFEAGEEIEAQIIRNLLLDDDDLFSGVFDEPKYIAQPNIGTDTGDFDLFSSVGGMELEGDDGGQRFSDSSVVGLNAREHCYGGHRYGEHRYGEHPSRTLFVRNINSNVEDAELKVLFERYGDIRTLYTACKHRGFVMISYYDIRAAQKAIRELQNKPLKHRKLDIHYSIPKDNPSDKDINQGTLVVFNLDSSISNGHLCQIFGVHGEIKEIRETPHKLSHRFIEFYDVRAAEAALRALNRTDIAGRQIKLEPSRPGGSRRCNVQPFSPERERKESDVNQKEGSPPNNSPSHGAITSSPLMENGFRRGIPSSVPPPSLLRVASVGNQSCQMHGVGPYGHFVEVNGVFGSSGNMCCPLHRPHYEWKISNPYHPHLLSPMMLPNSPPFFNGVHTHPLPQLHGPPIAPSNIINTHHHDVASAPGINHFLLDRQHAYAGMSPEASVFQPISFEGVGLSVDSTLHPSGLASPNIFPHVGGNLMDSSISSTNIGLHYSPQHRGCMFHERNLVIPMSNSFDAPNEWVKSRNKADSNQIGSRKGYELDIPRILRGKDIRTTIMLKNIPNKYTSKMLVAKLDERHRALYDFLYLPIDFKNKCNLGYAFINMINPLQIISLYETFNGKKWEKFNSEKVASLVYARIQGKDALIEHFDNSTVMNEERRFRPILFHSDGPNAGDEEPFPVTDKTPCREGEPRGTYEEKKHDESPSASANGEESSNKRDSS